ncbi:hypothetical protein CR970_00530 [Candidatus Saccharibacteria bacterium]|nr:MAG: hypothetical protein CR970_00530 [Candidatus Saccharibacteria bacterium]
MKLIGLSGSNGSGKDTIGHLLRDQFGWCFAGATEMLVAELEKRGLPTDRKHKANLSAEWRRQYGPAVIVDRGVEQFQASGRGGLIVGSLRHPSEADRVHELGGVMLWVDADSRVRYERITTNDRGRVEDKISYEQFVADEQREMYPEGDSATLHTAAVKERADLFIANNGNDIDAFKDHVREVLTAAQLLQ